MVWGTWVASLLHCASMGLRNTSRVRSGISPSSSINSTPVPAAQNAPLAPTNCTGLRVDEGSTKGKLGSTAARKECTARANSDLPTPGAPTSKVGCLPAAARPNAVNAVPLRDKPGQPGAVRCKTGTMGASSGMPDLTTSRASRKELRGAQFWS